MVQAQLTTGHIFDIQGFSVHDGPGCRTLVFFKGCSLDCPWCCNPEGLSAFPEPLYRVSKCSLDGLCIDACPQGAISLSEKGNPSHMIFNRAVCAGCNTYDCAKACCTGALNIGGYEITVDDLYATINRDRQYWGGGGGVTLTGGEPFLQPEFARGLLKRCYDAFIHTAVETCGNVAWENYECSLPYIDWIFFDLKTISPSPVYPFTHTAISNILGNARRIAMEFSGRLIFRLPVIPGFNDTNANIHETARFILSTGRNEINILPLHHLGRDKFNLVGKEYSMSGIKSPTKDEIQQIASRFSSLGLHCYIGSDTPF